jgi:hypothetical protein
MAFAQPAAAVPRLRCLVQCCLVDLAARGGSAEAVVAAQAWLEHGPGLRAASASFSRRAGAGTAASDAADDEAAAPFVGGALRLDRTLPQIRAAIAVADCGTRHSGDGGPRCDVIWLPRSTAAPSPVAVVRPVEPHTRLALIATVDFDVAAAATTVDAAGSTQSAAATPATSDARVGELTAFAWCAVAALTSDAPVHAIVPSTWLSGAASASGRPEPTSLQCLLAPTAEGAAAKTRVAAPPGVAAALLLAETQRRAEVCCQWLVQRVRRIAIDSGDGGGATTTTAPSSLAFLPALALTELSGAAMHAAATAAWSEQLSAAVQGKIAMPFGVAMSPLEWGPPAPAAAPATADRRVAAAAAASRGGGGDQSGGRFMEEGWLVVQRGGVGSGGGGGSGLVLGAAPMLGGAQLRVLSLAAALVGSSADELLAHLGDLCATATGVPGIGGAATLARPVVPPVVLFDGDASAWMASELPRSDAGAAAAVHQPATTHIAGWQDVTVAAGTATYRVVVAVATGGASAPAGLTVAILLRQSRVPFVGVPVSVAGDVARELVGDVAAMWDAHQSGVAALVSGDVAAERGALRRLYEGSGSGTSSATGLLVHAVVVVRDTDTAAAAGSESEEALPCAGALVAGGSVAAMRALLGPPTVTSADRTLDGSRALVDVIAAAYAEFNAPANVVAAAVPTLAAVITARGAGIAAAAAAIPFHASVVHELAAVGVVAAARGMASAWERRVVALPHPALRLLASLRTGAGPAALANAEREALNKALKFRAVAVVAPDGSSPGVVRVAIFSVPRATVSEAAAMHLGRVLPM